ncbi:MAG: hypothetical protein VZT48_01430 [Bulleidia sp.]|nr:hypothetical protein [Bulleidia sp.]
MVNNALLRQLQEAQVVIAMEEGLRKPAEQARHELDRMNAFHMITGMLLIACMIFALLSSWLDSLSSTIRHGILLAVAIIFLIDEWYCRKQTRLLKKQEAESEEKADAYHSEHAGELSFLEPTDFAPHVIAQLIRVVRNEEAFTMEEALDAYDGRIRAKKKFSKENGGN